MTSMIQAYVNALQHHRNNNNKPNNNVATIPVAPQKYSQDALRTGVRAYKPLGHILKDESFSLSKTLKSDAESLKYFYNGINGRGNDYSIGKINDVAIKLGGLGIAGMLATGQGSPLKKGMEFVGLACWLGAMSLWPKLAINAPIKHLKGVDLGTEYVTSKGHKKHFYSDPQFICWDMISDSEMEKMGDKLGIPKNIKNRRKATENKARQVAVQGNTLALLTAGFATPLAASLVADQLGKRALSPALSKIQEARADKMLEQMSLNLGNLVADKKLEAFINKELPSQISPKTLAGIKRLFAGLTSNKTLETAVNETINGLFSGKNISAATLSVDDNLISNISNMCNGRNPFKVDIAPIIAKTVKKHTKDGKLDKLSMPKFIRNLVEELKLKRAVSAEDSAKLAEEIKQLFNKSQVVTLTNADETVEKLTDLTHILKTYEVKVHETFDKKFFKYVWNGAVSTNADIWSNMPQNILSALELDRKTIKKLATAPSEEAVYQILSESIDKIVENPKQYDRAIRALGKSAAKVATKNEKYLKPTLSYLDSMEKLLTAYDANGDLAGLTRKLSTLFTERRREIIGKYASANNTMFAPIRILSILRDTKGSPEYATIKKALFECQTVEAFINRLDNLKESIKNETDYKKLVETIFGNLSADTRAKLPAGLAEKIDDSTTLIKHLLISQNDGVNTKYRLTDVNAISDAMRKTSLYEYMDDLFDININDKPRIFEQFKAVISANPHKADELKIFLKLSESEIASIKAGNFEILWANLMGNSQVGLGFIDNGRRRLRTVLEFIGAKDLSEFGGISINKSLAGGSSKMEATTFKNFIKDGAQNAFAYNKWFTRVGLAFVGLCAITGYAISRIGKRNDFNPDIYEERRA